MSPFIPPGECPVCGAEVPARAHSCPECGASDQDGWSEQTAADGLDLPEAAEASNDEAVQEKRPPSAAFNVLVVIILILIISGAWFLF